MGFNSGFKGLTIQVVYCINDVGLQYKNLLIYNA